MTAIKDTRSLDAGFSNSVELKRFVYDFSKDGGAQGALDICTFADAAVIVAAWATVKTTVTSGGSATVKWGVTGSDAKFMDTTQGAKANLTAAATIVPPAVEGTPNVLPLPVAVAAGAKALMTIGTADLTAGKIEFVVVIAKA